MTSTFFINAIVWNYFVIDKWGLVYQEIGRNKIASECEFNRILLDVMINGIIWPQHYPKLIFIIIKNQSFLHLIVKNLLAIILLY